MSNPELLFSQKPKIILDNKYLLFNKFAEGATAKVYLGIDSTEPTHKLYAFKLFGYGFDDSTYSLDNYNKCQESEFSALKKLSHSNICQIKDYGYGPAFKPKNNKLINVPYVVLNYIPHGDLFQYLYFYQKNGLSPGFGETRTTKFFFYKILTTVEYIHNQGIYHRDLKIENILIDEDFNFKICDFGFAKNNNNINGLFQTVLGTKNYMSPEILKNQKYFGFANDIFSLGVILYVLVTGNYPFKEAKSTDSRYRFFFTNSFEKYWEESRVNVTEEFKQLFQIMVNIDPIQRPSISEIKASKWLKDIAEEIKESRYEEFYLRDLKGELRKRYSVVKQRKEKTPPPELSVNNHPENKTSGFFNIQKDFTNCKKKQKNSLIFQKNIDVLFSEICQYYTKNKITINQLQGNNNSSYRYLFEISLDSKTKVILSMKSLEDNHYKYNSIEFVRCLGDECKLEACYEKLKQNFHLLEIIS